MPHDLNSLTGLREWLIVHVELFSCCEDGSDNPQALHMSVLRWGVWVFYSFHQLCLFPWRMGPRGSSYHQLESETSLKVVKHYFFKFVSCTILLILRLSWHEHRSLIIVPLVPEALFILSAVLLPLIQTESISNVLLHQTLLTLCYETLDPA